MKEPNKVYNKGINSNKKERKNSSQCHDQVTYNSMNEVQRGTYL